MCFPCNILSPYLSSLYIPAILHFLFYAILEISSVVTKIYETPFIDLHCYSKKQSILLRILVWKLFVNPKCELFNKNRVQEKFAICCTAEYIFSNNLKSIKAQCKSIVAIRPLLIMITKSVYKYNSIMVKLILDNSASLWVQV